MALHHALGFDSGLECSNEPENLLGIGALFVLISAPLWLVSVCAGALGLVYGPRRDIAAAALGISLLPLSLVVALLLAFGSETGG